MLSMSTVNPKEQIARKDGTSVPETDTNRISVARPGLRNRVALILHGAINYLMPAGFEDENGFHCVSTATSDSTTSSDKQIS
jgi:hypothetical protein